MKIEIEDRNTSMTAEYIIRNMIEREHQFSLITEHDTALVSFYKGNWTIQIGKEPWITVRDDSTVDLLDSQPSMAEMFIDSRLAFHRKYENSASYLRETPAHAIYDYIAFRLHIDSSLLIKIDVIKPERNGYIRGNEIVLTA